MSEIIMHPLNGDEFRIENPLSELRPSIFYPVQEPVSLKESTSFQEVAYTVTRKAEFRHMGTHRHTGLPYYEEQPQTS